ncbi:MAG: hypothetical protein JWL92_608, partial [Candidatus Nomurabacteria bacterium]|nr:hypothetical protein [Candidatus Nomurabacteria bacterium]
LIAFSFTVSKAAPLYIPGETLDPQCIPGSTDCSVSSSASVVQENGNDAYFTGGKFGIGTNTPQAAFDVEGGGTFLASGTGSLPDLGTGTRMAWNPSLAAIRAGFVSGTQWDSANVGYASVAFGKNNIASGESSTSFGVGNTASGIFSSAFGNSTTASAAFATAFGASSTASFPFATAFGAGTTASGAFSTSFGYFTNAASAYSTAFGFFNVGGGNPGIQVGTDPLFEVGNGTSNVARSDALLILKNGKTIFGGNIGIGTTDPRAAIDLEGDGAIIAAGTDGAGMTVPNLGAGARLMWIPSAGAFRAGTVDSNQWDSANVGVYSTAFGYNNVASGEGSVVFGEFNTASGYNSVVFGGGNIASNEGAAAFGGGTIASGRRSFAAGDSGTTASGDVSAAFGLATTASGGYSASFGSGTIASGAISTAFGLATTSSSLESFSLGRFNVDGGTDALSWIGTDPLFEIGNGAGIGSLADAIIVLKNGKTGIGLDPASYKPTYLLQVGKSSDATGIVARFQNTSGTCDVNPTAGSVVCSSDMNLKKNVALLADGSAWNFNTNVSASNRSVLGKILALSPVSYNWSAESDSATKHPGFIAQDIKQLFPDLVYADPSSGLLSLNYTGLIPYTIQAIKEMNMNVIDISNLDRDNTWRNALVAWLGNASNGITNIFTKKITTDQLCVGTTCVTQQQFMQMVQNSNNSGGATVLNPPVPPVDDTETPVVDESTAVPVDQGTEATPPIVPVGQE